MAYTTIDDPSKYFQTALYTGDDGTSRAVTNDGNSDLQPDWIWIKDRGDTSAPIVFDSTRGVNKKLRTDTADSEETFAYLASFNSDGFTIATDDGAINADTSPYVAWQWNSNGGTRTTYAESGNNPGGGFQVNTTAGFSIVDWTGTGATGTAAHGLGAVPHIILVKCRNTAHDWAVYHHKNTAAPETDFLVLNDTSATADQVQKWQDTAPTSTNITFGDGGGVNANNQTHIAYVFTEIQGYSKFGSYIGNGNADGPFVYTGFSPAWVMVKRSDNTGSAHWMIKDSTRNPHNTVTDYLHANKTDAEGDDVLTDFLSNGFKQRSSNAINNANNSVFVYMAFAKSPFVSSKGIPTTAR